MLADIAQLPRHFCSRIGEVVCVWQLHTARCKQGRTTNSDHRLNKSKAERRK